MRDQNKPEATWDRYSMAGLWFEYVWDASFSMGHPYECSTWIVLSDEAESGEGQYVVYNNMLQHKKEGEEERSQEFIKFSMVWDEPSEAGNKALASYSRHDSEPSEDGAEEDKDKARPEQKLQIIHTDYH